MPSLRHDLFAVALPRLRKVREIDDETAERQRIERWHREVDRSFPTRAVRRFDRLFEVHETDIGFPVHTMRRRGTTPRRTVLYLHGGGFVGPTDPFHVKYAAKLATELDAEVVLPDYPLAPEHTWRDSHDALVELASSLVAERPTIVAGDSAGGGIALAVALSLRDRVGAQPTHLLLHAPWVDLTTSTPATRWYARRDPWLMLTKLEAYARWWAGSDADLDRPEVSPALADLAGLPPALVFCGTRDLLLPGCRLLASRAREAGWDLTFVEEPDLIHVYPILSMLPEARTAWRTTADFLG